MRGLSDQLHRAAQKLWQVQVEHAFVRGIADGTLDAERSRHYLRQDYLFLIEYSRWRARGRGGSS